MKYLGKTRDQLDDWRVQRGNQALDFMDRQLEGRDWFVGTVISIADIALLAYTRLADEGGFDNSSRKNVTNWIARCERELALAPRH
jgi:glutathione S-transferase